MGQDCAVYIIWVYGWVVVFSPRGGGVVSTMVLKRPRSAEMGPGSRLSRVRFPRASSDSRLREVIHVEDDAPPTLVLRQEVTRLQRQVNNLLRVLESSPPDASSSKGLRCSICLEVYSEGIHRPIVLPCLHMHCSACCRRLVKGVGVPGPGACMSLETPILCPVCRCSCFRLSSPYL